MKTIFLTGILYIFHLTVLCQNLTQTVRGTVKDADNKTPLIGALIMVSESQPVKGGITDVEGNFRLEKVATGRITLIVTYMGYEPATLSNIVVNSGKEVILNIELTESANTMEEVVITASKDHGEALNEMAMVSARSISPEQTNRYAGSFNDPSRIMSNFAGITATPDGSNDVIVRGNSPKYMQWRLEGVQITNPNHFADQSSAGGSVSILNNNLLAASDFYTGAFTPEYGDVLSGVYDVRLRTGNNEQYESVFGLGLLGTDITLEGPFKKGYDGSFLANYRYSTVSLIDEIGLLPDDLNGIPKFQDAAFKLVFPGNKLGTFSFFGLGGKSYVKFDDVTPAIWELPGDRSMSAEITEDFEKKSFLMNTGLNHSITVSKKSYLNTTLLYSAEGIQDNIFENRIYKLYNDQGGFVRDSVLNTTLNFTGDLKKTSIRGAITYHHKINARSKVQIGTKYALLGYDYQQSRLKDGTSVRETLVDFSENISSIRNFISWKYHFNDRLTLVSGLHNMNVLLNGKSTLEPRASLTWQTSNTGRLSLGYGKHSMMESVHSYFAKVERDGQLIEPNRNMGLLKAHHYVVGYEKRFGKNLMAKVEAYYQHLYDLPVENSDTSIYATINEGLEFQYVDLVNKGKGKNYGLEMTLERFFVNNFYFLLNGSIYESRYTALDGVERNTRYNGNFLGNFLFGKEFTRLGKKDNQTLGLNTKIFLSGGQKIIPLLRDEQGNLNVNTSQNQYWDYSKAYESSLGSLYSITVSVSYKWNKPKATHELFLNLDNITNTQGKISEFYDESKPGNIGHMKQFGFFPNLMYRVYF